MPAPLSAVEFSGATFLTSPDLSLRKPEEKAAATIAAARVEESYQDGALGQYRRFGQWYCILRLCVAAAPVADLALTTDATARRLR